MPKGVFSTIQLGELGGSVFYLLSVQSPAEIALDGLMLYLIMTTRQDFGTGIKSPTQKKHLPNTAKLTYYILNELNNMHYFLKRASDKTIKSRV